MAHSDNTEQKHLFINTALPIMQVLFSQVIKVITKMGREKCLQVWNANRKLKNYKIRARINYYTTGEWIAVDTLCFGVNIVC